MSEPFRFDAPAPHVVLPPPPKTWQVWFHPVTGDHLPDGRQGVYVENPAYDSTKPITPTNLPKRRPVPQPAEFTFRASLQIGKYTTGRSMLRVELIDWQGQRRFYMSMKYFWDNILPDYDGRTILGTWGFVRHGTTTLLVRCGE